MEFKTGLNNLVLPVIGLGTWGIGGMMESDTSKDDESIQAIQSAIGLGYTHIDTAELYGAGHTEDLIGKAIQGYDRSQIILTSKVMKSHLRYDDLIVACQQSLERLKTDSIDIYLIHAPNPTLPIQETMRAMEYLMDHKLIRHIGVSNFSVAQMQEAQKYSQYPIVINQIPYNLATRNTDYKGSCINMEKEIIPYCQENNILIMAYRPIERGLLLDGHPLIQKLSEKYRKTPAQIAMNWLISKKNIVTIPKSIDYDHQLENLGSLGWKISDDDIGFLNEMQV